MNATTVGAGTPAGTAETQGATKKGVIAPLRGVWWFSLGAAAVAGAFVGNVVKTLVQRGKEVEPHISAPLKMGEGGVTEILSGAGTKLKGFSTTLGRGAQKVEGAVEERIAAVLERTQQPVRTEIQELAKKVEELAGKVAQLEAKGQEPPPVA
jgi:polyhydroxyalkanoate synthesis regulator phasin